MKYKTPQELFKNLENYRDNLIEDNKDFFHFDVLDKGFVKYLEHMGSDNKIAQSARTSYQQGTKSINDNKTLIRYLIRKFHSSPLEMGEIKFHIKAPIFVIIQVIRHRTACLSGDTNLWFDEPYRKNKGSRKRRNMTIKEFYNKFHNSSDSIFSPFKKEYDLSKIEPDKLYSVSDISKLIGMNDINIRTAIRNGNLQAKINNSLKKDKYKISGKQMLNYLKSTRTWKVNNKQRYTNMNLRYCNEITGEILHTNIKDIWSNGIRDVYLITLENGYTIKSTDKHLFLTQSGWGTLKSLTELSINKNNKVTWRKEPKFAINGITAYKDKSWLKKQKENGASVSIMAQQAGCSYHTIRKYLKIHDLKFTSSEKGRLSGKSQKGQKRKLKKRVYTPEGLQKIRNRQSGSKSRFWKGGSSTLRKKIATWTTKQAKHIFERDFYKCRICNGKDDLNAHHIDPVWNNQKKGFDFDNLITLCFTCHNNIHRLNQELSFLDWFNKNKDLSLFWKHQNIKLKRPDKKKKTPCRKLIRTFSKLKSIEYIGKEEVFDLEVKTDFHNFVANGFIVHNSVNSESARYSIIKDEFYIPELSELKKQSNINKQGSGELIKKDIGKQILLDINEATDYSSFIYNSLLTKELAREKSRIVLPMNTYMNFHWKIDLNNLFKFLKLRLDSHAQEETRRFAEAIYSIAKFIFPESCIAFEDYVNQSYTLSRMEINVIKNCLKDIDKSNIDYFLSKEESFSKREIKEFKEFFLEE